MSARLFVGNLPFDVNEADLRELFAPVGPLSYVFLPVDRDSGKRRGFAFIEFSDEAKAAEATRRFNEQQFRGRPLALSEARARDTRTAMGVPMKARVPRLPEAYDHGPGMGEPGQRRERRGRDDTRRSAKSGSRNTRGEMTPKKGPKRERAGGRVFGFDVDDYEDLDEMAEEEVE